MKRHQPWGRAPGRILQDRPAKPGLRVYAIQLGRTRQPASPRVPRWASRSPTAAQAPALVAGNLTTFVELTCRRTAQVRRGDVLHATMPLFYGATGRPAAKKTGTVLPSRRAPRPCRPASPAVAAARKNHPRRGGPARAHARRIAPSWLAPRRVRGGLVTVTDPWDGQMRHWRIPPQLQAQG